MVRAAAEADRAASDRRATSCTVRPVTIRRRFRPDRRRRAKSAAAPTTSLRLVRAATDPVRADPADPAAAVVVAAAAGVRTSTDLPVRAAPVHRRSARRSPVRAAVVRADPAATDLYRKATPDSVLDPAPSDTPVDPAGPAVHSMGCVIVVFFFQSTLN